MGQRSHCNHRAMGVERAVWCVNFRPDTANDPTYVNGKGVVSVTHLATGQWTIKFTNAAYKIVGFSTGLGLGTPAVGSLSATFDNVGTNTPLEAVLSYVTSGAADIASGADNWISLIVEVELSKEG
jgi:hypothetical protein